MHWVDRVACWLDSLGKEKGVQLQLNENGVCSFGFGNGMLCDIQVLPESPVLYLTSPFKVIQEDETEIFRRLLEYNYDPADTAGAIFAIDSSNSTIVLTHRHIIQENDTEIVFSELLFKFLSSLEAAGSMIQKENPSAKGG